MLGFLVALVLAVCPSAPRWKPGDPIPEPSWVHRIIKAEFSGAVLLVTVDAGKACVSLADRAEFLSIKDDHTRVPAKIVRISERSTVLEVKLTPDQIRDEFTTVRISPR